MKIEAKQRLQGASNNLPVTTGTTLVDALVETLKKSGATHAAPLIKVKGDNKHARGSIDAATAFAPEARAAKKAVLRFLMSKGFNKRNDCLEKTVPGYLARVCFYGEDASELIVTVEIFKKK